MKANLLLSGLLCIFISSCEKESEIEDEPQIVINSSGDCITLDNNVNIFFTAEKMSVDFSSVKCDYSCTYFKAGMTATRDYTSTDMYKRVIGFEDALEFTNSGNTYTIELNSSKTRFNEYGQAYRYEIIVGATIDGKEYAKESVSYP